MRLLHRLVACPMNGSTLLLLLFLLLLGVATRAQKEAKTDPAEVAALDAIFRRWKLQPPTLLPWNISAGEPCSGAAVDGTDIDNPSFNPGLKCNCSYNAGAVCHITKLKVFALDVVGQIPEELKNLTYLKNLDLRQNYLTGSLPAFFGELTAMQYLSVGTNALTGIVPKELGKLTDLVSLGFTTNKFDGPLPEELQSLTKLEQLYIDSCGLSGELPSTFSKLGNLKIFWASDNNFTGTIPDYIGTLSNLIDLRLHGNYFDGPIPASLSNLVKLTNLQIGDLVSESSSLAFVANMTSLSDLTLRNCRISDNLGSVEFSHFVRLRYLDLSFNSIAGRVPPSLLNLTLLKFLFLGSNNLSGSLPDTISPSLATLDFSYNMLSGEFPSWVSTNNLRVNLVFNNFVIDGFNSSVLPSGLDCLQRNTPCFLGSPQYSYFAVDSGGTTPTTSSDNTVYETDEANLQNVSYYVTNPTRWGVSAPNGSSVINNPRNFSNTPDTALFQTARTSPSSLRYYGIGLKNGNYNVVLQFSELQFPDNQSWRSVGRRIFDIYIQGELVKKDFDMKNETNGKSDIVLQKQYMAKVTRNFLEIHLFWAGKGTCCIPAAGFHGPSISALSASFYVSNNEGEGLKKNKTVLIVAVVVGAAVVGFLALTGTFAWKQKRKRLEVEMEELLSIVGRPNIFHYGEIKSATNNFSPSNILGRGGYGLVYKGKLLDGRMVAVKQLSPTSRQGKTEFMAEIATISAVQHRNLVKLHGCCIESNVPLLVYEYMENGSLDRAIFAKTNLNLDWRTRFEICVGIARGLAYLHEESSTRIVHRDIKTSNILLDADLNPKISDFGLARHYKDSMTHLSTGVAGTLGYLAPEYAMMGHLTEKADVFAFGIVALEIIAGRPNFDESLEEDKRYLLGLAWCLHESRRTLELLDPKLAEYNEEDAARVVSVVLLCTMGLPQQRPPMSKVVAMLTEDIEMTKVDATMRPSYVPEWQLNRGNDGLLSSSSMTQPSGSQVSAPSSSSNNPKLHRDTSPLALSPCSSGEIDDGS